MVLALVRLLERSTTMRVAVLPTAADETCCRRGETEMLFDSRAFVVTLLGHWLWVVATVQIVQRPAGPIRLGPEVDRW